MENKAHFGSLTPRMQAYRESVLDQKPYIDAQRAVLATESYKKNLNQPAVMKRALMLQNILAKMDIYIEDETVLVGNQSSVNRGAPVFPEYTMKFIMDEAMSSILRKRPSSSSERSLPSGRTTTFVPAAKRLCRKRCRSTWTQDSSAWRASSTQATRIWQLTMATC